MKYCGNFKNKEGSDYSVMSMDGYQISKEDIEYFSFVLSDLPVRRYITDDALSKYGHESVLSLTQDILGNSAIRWTENKERRFLVRDNKNNPIGMIGVTLSNLNEGELWYYKTSAVGSLMSEALDLVLRFLKQEGITDLQASTNQDNLRSAQILAQAGFSIDENGNEIIWRKTL